jgi:hypothetical protein
MQAVPGDIASIRYWPPSCPTKEFTNRCPIPATMLRTVAGPDDESTRTPVNSLVVVGLPDGYVVLWARRLNDPTGTNPTSEHARAGTERPDRKSKTVRSDRGPARSFGLGTSKSTAGRSGNLQLHPPLKEHT